VFSHNKSLLFVAIIMCSLYSNNLKKIQNKAPFAHPIFKVHFCVFKHLTKYNFIVPQKKRFYELSKQIATILCKMQTHKPTSRLSNRLCKRSAKTLIITTFSITTICILGITDIEHNVMLSVAFLL
jgi:hypothetical protein